MSFVSIGDLSSHFRMRYFNTQLKQQAESLGAQMATGKVTDLTKAVGGDFAGFSALSRSVAMIAAYQQNATEVATRADVTQGVLQVLQSLSETASPAYQGAAISASNPSVSTNARDATAGLETAFGALNTDIGGQYLFAGLASDTPPLGSAAQLLDQLEALTATETTAGGVATVLESFLQDPGGGYETLIYQGSDQSATAVRISETETAALNVTAFQSDIRDVLQGFALAALVDRGVLASSLTEQAKLMGHASERLSRGAAEMVDIAAEIGGIQNRTEMVQVRNQAQKNSFQLILNGLEQADPYETATAFQAAQTQLEALYISTARLSQLSLTRYLG